MPSIRCIAFFVASFIQKKLIRVDQVNNFKAYSPTALAILRQLKWLKPLVISRSILIIVKR